jgi:hypothetical protein
MHTNLIKIEKTIKGTADLFTAMDKGFAKVESDLTLLKRFRQICFEANDKIESALPLLQNHIVQSIHWTTLAEPGQFYLQVRKDIFSLKEIIKENILSINSYIIEFEELWKTSFSLNALLKFKLLLMNEFTVLENEIQKLEMEFIRLERSEKINPHPKKMQVYNESN